MQINDSAGRDKLIHLSSGDNRCIRCLMFHKLFGTSVRNQMQKN